MKASLGIAGFIAAGAVLVSPGGARAAGNPNGFGDKGQIIISADRLVPIFNYASSSVTDTQNNVKLTNSSSGSAISLLFTRSLATTEGFAPINVHTLPRVAADVTVIPQLTLGAAIAFGFGLGGTNSTEQLTGNTKTKRDTDAPTSTAIGFVPRVGYILPLSDIFAFWPRAGFGIYSVSSSQESTDNNGVVTTRKTTDTLFSLDLDPQFALVPLEHFFIHAGPVVNIPITGSRSTSQTTGTTTTNRSLDASVFNIGLSAGLGGWFNVF